MQNATTKQPNMFKDLNDPIKPFKLQTITAMKLQQLRLLNEAAIAMDKANRPLMAEDARKEAIQTRYEAMNPELVLQDIQRFFTPRQVVA